MVINRVYYREMDPLDEKTKNKGEKEARPLFIMK